VEKIDQEIEKIEVQYSEAQNRAQAAYDQISSNRTATLHSDSRTEGTTSNMHQQVATPQSQIPMHTGWQ